MPGEAQDLALRAAGPLCFRSSTRKTPATQRPRTLSDAIDAWRGTGPRPTVTVAFSYFRITIFRVAEKSPADSV